MGRKRQTTLIVAVVLLAVLGVAGYFSFDYFTEASETVTDKTQFLMDTVVTIRAIGKDSEQVTQDAFSEMKRVESVFSRFIYESEISEINRRAGQWVEVSEETLDVIAEGIRFGELTNGTFDITIGPLLALWGFGDSRHNQRVPSEEELAEALAHVDYTRVELDRDNLLVRIPEGFILDLGGIAKGFAVDQGAETLRAAKIKHALVNAGGDISAIGTRQDGNLWRVGIQDPRETSEILAIVQVRDKAIVTSGDYQRYFEQDGVRFHHIIDPFTGYPADGLTSVSVVAPTAREADAYSTAFFVLGLEASKELVERLPEIETVIVDETGEIWVSSGLREVIQMR